jgi:hypothetical protein
MGAPEADNLHEAWIHEMRKHIRFNYVDNAVISVAYGSADQHHSLEFTEVVKEVCVALAFFKNAVISLQESGAICNSVSILFKTQINSIAVVEVRNFDLSLAGSPYVSPKDVESWDGSEGHDLGPLSANWESV